MKSLVNKFIKGETQGKNGRYEIEDNLLTYKNVVSIRGNKYWETETKAMRDCCALRLSDGTVIGNSSTLPTVMARMAFGRPTQARGEAKIQTLLSSKVPMLPFSVFKQANLDIRQTKILERGKAETVKRKIDASYYDNTKQQWIEKTKIVEVHFTGASLFEVQGKYYLFDIDREEIKHKIFNPFLVEIPKPVKTIKEAYDALVPNEVKTAQKKGLKVIRQGEWFLIPVKKEFKPEQEKRQWGKNPNQLFNKRFSLRVGNNRPNFASKGVKFNGVTYVSGVLSHSGREHRDVKLNGWFKPVPNTSNNSFTITGDID